jgi:hypothetical protein
VTLIDRGPPAGYRLPVGPGSGRVVFNPDEGLRVRANGYCLVELLPRLPDGDWMIEADLRCLDGDGMVGLLVGITRAMGADRAATAGFVMACVEPEPGRAGPPVVLGSTRVCVVESSDAHLFPVTEHQEQFPPGWEVPVRNPAAGKPARTAGVTIRPASVEAELEGRRFPAWTAAEYTARRDHLLQDRSVVAVPGPPLHGGVGVYVKLCTVRIDRFVVRPLNRPG